MLFKSLKILNISILALVLGACATSIQPLGKVGPKKLGVYLISHNDFLTASRMMVVLDKKGNVAAYTGGTSSGLGAVALQTTGELVTAGAIVYGAKSIQHGLQNAHVQVRGIPKRYNMKADINVNGTLVHQKN